MHLNFGMHGTMEIYSIHLMRKSPACFVNYQLNYLINSSKHNTPFSEISNMFQKKVSFYKM